jgi:hypothetical protein
LLLIKKIKLDHLAGKVIVNLYLGRSEPFFLGVVDEPLYLTWRKFFVIRSESFQNTLGNR